MRMHASRHPITIYGLCALLLCLTAAAARAAPGRGDAPFDAFAGEILDGLSATDYTRIPALSGYGAPRVAVWPFKPDSTPIPVEVANEYNSRLLAELSRQNGGRFRFVARDTLKTVIAEIDSTTVPGEGGGDAAAPDPVTDLLRNAKVDVLVVGKLRRAGGGVVLSYQAVSVEDGGLFASTAPRPLSLPPGAAERLLTLDEAVRDAARALAAEGGNVDSLAVVPLASGAVNGGDDRFGRYFAVRVAEDLRDRLADPVTGARPRLVAEGKESHRLGGTYWDFGGHLEVRLVLSGGDGADTVWRRRIRTESVIGMVGPRRPVPVPPRLDPSRAAPPAQHRRIGPPPRDMVRFHPRPTGGRPVVAETQILLAGLGYDPGPADGVMKPRTRTALAAYQSDSGLPVTGRMTRRVVERLRRDAR